MARPIVLSDELIQKMAADFATAMQKAKLSDGRVTYTQQFAYDGSTTAEIRFTPQAYFKMLLLIQGMSDEVAWHGTVTREEENVFIIHDILIYPQVVTGATVNTDQEAYQTWLMHLDDDTANTLHFQAHSHVNMGVTPSGVDLSHQEKIISQLGKDDFFIFMIWNKRLEYKTWIYDMKHNVLYESDDVIVRIDGCEFDEEEFVDDAKKMVVRKSYSRTNYGGYSGSPTTAAGKGSSPATASKPADKSSGKKDKTGKGSGAGKHDPYGLDEDVDYDRFIFGGYDPR